MTIQKKKKKSPVGEVFYCPMSERLYKIVGYSKDGLPIAHVVNCQLVNEDGVKKKKS